MVMEAQQSGLSYAEWCLWFTVYEIIGLCDGRLKRIEKIKINGQRKLLLDSKCIGNTYQDTKHLAYRML